jgi:hypothetical protein
VALYNGLSSAQTLFLNGSSKASNTTTGAFGYTTYGIGNYASAPVNSEPFTGKISEVLIYSNALTPVQRAQVENYLYQKWSVVVTSSALTHDPRYNDSQTGTYANTGNYNSFTITSNIATLGGTAYIIGATPIHNNITGPTTYSDGANPVYLYKPTQPTFLNVTNTGNTVNIAWGFASVLTEVGLLQNVRDYYVQVTSTVSGYPPVNQFIAGFSNTTVTGFNISAQILTVSVTAVIPLGGAAGYSNPIYGFPISTQFGIPSETAITLSQNDPLNPTTVTVLWPAGGPDVSYYKLFYLDPRDTAGTSRQLSITCNVAQAGSPPTARFNVSLGYPYTLSGAGYNSGDSPIFPLSNSATFRPVTFAPSNLNSTYNATSITLNWNAVVDASYYFIQGVPGVDTASGFGCNFYKSTSLVISTDANGGALIPGSNYTYYIRAYTAGTILTNLNFPARADGWPSAFSQQLTTTLKIPADSVSSTLTATQNGSIVTLNWATPTNVPLANTTYTITTAGTPASVQTIAPGTTVTTTVNITPGNQYTFTKTATCFGITGAQQQVLNFQTYNTANAAVSIADLGTGAVRAIGTGGNQGGTWRDSDGTVLGSGTGFTKDYTGLTKGSTFNKTFNYVINGNTATITPSPASITLANPFAVASTTDGTSGTTIRLVLSATGTKAGFDVSWTLSIPAGLTGGSSTATGTGPTITFNAPATGVNTRYTFSNIVVSNGGFSSPPISVQYTTPNIIINTPTLLPDTNANIVLSTTGTIRPSVPVPPAIRGSILWLDGADPNGDGSASPAAVSVWKDKSGNGNNATSQSSTVPVVSNGLSFDGATKYLAVPGIAGTLVNKPFVVFAVESYNGTGARKGWYFGDDAGGGATDSLLTLGYRQNSGAANGANGAYTMSFWNDDLNDTSFTPTSPLNVPRVWTNYLPQAANRNIRLNGALKVTHTNFNRLTSFLTPVIGRGGEAAYYYKGVISELIVFNTDIQLTAIEDIESYLLAKWSLTTLTTPTSWTFPTTITRNSGGGGNLPQTGGTVPALTYGPVTQGAIYQADANSITAFYRGYQTTYPLAVVAGRIPVVEVASAVFTTNGDGTFTLTVTATGVPPGGTPSWNLPQQTSGTGTGTLTINTTRFPTGTTATATYIGGAAGRTYQIPVNIIFVTYNGANSPPWGAVVNASSPTPVFSSATSAFFGCVEDFNRYKPNPTFPLNSGTTLATTEPTITLSPVGTAAGSMAGAVFSWTVPTPTGLTLKSSSGTTTLEPTFTYTGGEKFYNGNPKTYTIAATNTEVASFAMGTGNYIMQFNLVFTTQVTPSTWANILLTTTVGGSPPTDTRYPSFFVAGNDAGENKRKILFSCYEQGTFVPTIPNGTVATFQAIQFSGQIQLNVFTNGTLFFQWTAPQPNLTSATTKLYMPGIPSWNPGSASGLVTITNMQYVVDGVTINPTNGTGTGGMGTYPFSGIVLRADGFSSTAGTATATLATPLYSARLTGATIATNQTFFRMTLQAQGGIPAFTGSDGYAYTCTAVSSSDNNYLNRLAISTATTANLGSTQPSLGTTFSLAVGVQRMGVVGPLINFFGLADVKNVTNLTYSATSPQTATSGQQRPATLASVSWTKPVLPPGSDTSYYKYQVFIGTTQIGGDIVFDTTSATIPAANLTWGTTNVKVIVKYTFGTFTKSSGGVSTGIVINPTASYSKSSAGAITSYRMPPGDYTARTVTVRAVGPGGNDGGVNGCKGGGGGGSGGYIRGTFTISPGQVINGTVGGAGTATASTIGIENIVTSFSAGGGAAGGGTGGDLWNTSEGGNGGTNSAGSGATVLENTSGIKGDGCGTLCNNTPSWRSCNGATSVSPVAGEAGRGKGRNQRSAHDGYIDWSF